MKIIRIRNIPKADVEDIIELVGHKDRIGDKVRKYSLGMKQRLGLAAALISKPKLLILEEPTNGLDPTGILDFRNIVKKAARERNTAVFVSSHILSEVQQLCDKVAFINNGTIQAVESINGDNAVKDTETIEIVTDDIKITTGILKDLAFVREMSQNNDGLLIKIAEDTTPEVIFTLVERKVRIKEVYKKQQGLEERYIELVEGGNRNA